MKNVYDGVVVLDDKGEAVIELPDWFGALNRIIIYIIYIKHDVPMIHGIRKQ
jgi:hypothetical protein